MCISKPSKVANSAGILLWSICLFLLFSCQPDDEEGTIDSTYRFVKPANFPEPTYTFDNNPVTQQGFLLGKKLFFDPILSRDGTVACNNCHIQATAFADGQQHPFSVGVDNQHGTRNAPSLANLAFMREFFWDGGVTHLDFAPTNAIENELEMDESLANVVAKLNQDEEYPALFKQAFGIDTITSPYMLHAFSQFLVMMVSANSRYDKYVRNEGETLTDEELAGMRLFEEKCSVCHEGELFSNFSYHNNGISAAFTDEGRARISEHPADQGKFRVPSLRNVARTAPYMHNAKFKMLEEVLQHYASGVVASSTLDPLLNNGEQLGIPMSEEEQQQIITFLKTLSDLEFVADERFMNTSNP